MGKSLRFPCDRILIGPSGNLTARGFSFSVTQANITSAGTAPVTKNTYTAANQPQADTIEVVSSDGADTTQTIIHVGIDANGNRIEESVSLNGATAVATTGTFTYWEFSVLSATTAGNITIREASADQAITTITAGQLTSQVAHIFSGEHALLLTEFSCAVTSAAGNVTGTLRRYAAASSCVALTGYTELDSIAILDGEGIAPTPKQYWPLAFRIGPGEYACVSVVGEGGNDEDVTVTVGGIILPCTVP